MKKNLNNKVILIVAVLLVFLYGIFGIPSGLSGKALVEALNSRIHRGLDLQGGVHLILQVEVKEAVNTETDNVVARVQQDLKSASLSFSQAYKPDPLKQDGTGKPELVQIDGVPTANSSAVRSILDQKYSSEYDVTGSNNETSFLLTMKPQIEKALDEKTVQQAIESGVAAPVITLSLYQRFLSHLTAW